QPRSRWVKECGAHVIGAYEQTDIGECFVERIELDHRKFQPTILDHVWREYAHFHEPILDWLKHMIDDQEAEVRDRAAAAVGQLCKYDFEYLYQDVLLPWANQADSHSRAAVAGALSVLAFEQCYLWHAREMLRYWSNHEQNWRLCWTAAAAYSGFVG